MSFFPKQPASRNGVTQTIAVGAASAAAGAAFGSETYQLRLAANTALNYRIGDGAQTATAADPLLPANTMEYVIVSPGQRIAAIEAASGGIDTAAPGTLWVTELS
jgi:hypothetical protein